VKISRTSARHLLTKAQLGREDFFVNYFFWFSLFTVISTFIRVPGLIHLCGHKDRPWLSSREPMMSLFAQQLLFPRAAGWQPNQKTVIVDHETSAGIPTAETPSLLIILIS
jgi:hypothetical protein